MYNPASQNIQIGIRTEIDKCSYSPNMKDYLTNMIMQVMNYPRKQAQAKYCVKNQGQDKIIVVIYPMNVPFMKKSYNVPIQILFMKNIPYEPPQIFLEVVQGSAPNPQNKDVDQSTRRVMTNTLKNWGQFSNIENAMNEIFASFSAVFPIYKTSGKNPPPAQKTAYQPAQNTGYQPNTSQYGGYKPNQSSIYGNNNAGTGGGGIYDVLNNAVQTAYQDNKYGPYKAPTTSIYGRSMTLEGNANQNKPNTNAYGAGGIYAQNNNYGQGGIYGNQGYIPPSSGIYGNNTNQYGNPSAPAYNNNYNYNNNQYGYNQNPPSGQYSAYNPNPNSQYGYNNPSSPNNLGFNPNDELKNIVLNELSGKLIGKVIEERKRLNMQNQKLNEYKNQMVQENRRIEEFLSDQATIRSICEDDMSNICTSIKNIEDYNKQNQNITITSDNCLTFLDIPNPDCLKIIANEVSMEEMIILVKRAYERKKIGFEEAISFMRNTTRELFAVKFLKNKAIKSV